VSNRLPTWPDDVEPAFWFVPKRTTETSVRILHAIKQQRSVTPLIDQCIRTRAVLPWWTTRFQCHIPVAHCDHPAFRIRQCIHFGGPFSLLVKALFDNLLVFYQHTIPLWFGWVLKAFCASWMAFAIQLSCCYSNLSWVFFLGDSRASAGF